MLEQERLSLEERIRLSIHAVWPGKDIVKYFGSVKVVIPTEVLVQHALVAIEEKLDDPTDYEWRNQ